MPDDGSGTRVDVAQWLSSHSLRMLDELRQAPDPKKRRRGSRHGRGSRHERDTEEPVRRLLSMHLPARYGVDAGVVIDTHGGQTQPLSAVVFDRERMPVIRGATDQGIWPFESVYAAVEVREKLNSDTLRSAVENIATFKRLQREKSNSVGAAGFTVSGELSNPPVGLLVAHEHAEDLVPSEPPFNDIVGSVPREQQIDAYCVVSGPLGCLGREIAGVGLLLGFSNQGPTKIYHFEFGAGAVAAFVLMVTGILNKIRLGEPALLHYLRAASP